MQLGTPLTSFCFSKHHSPASLPTITSDSLNPLIISRLIRSQPLLTQSPVPLMEFKTRNSLTSPSPMNISISPRVQKARAKSSYQKLPSYSEALRSRIVPQPAVPPPPYSPKPCVSPRKVTQTTPVSELPPYYDVDPVRAAAVAMSRGVPKGGLLKTAPKNRSHRLKLTLRC